MLTVKTNNLIYATVIPDSNNQLLSANNQTPNQISFPLYFIEQNQGNLVHDKNFNTIMTNVLTNSVNDKLLLFTDDNWQNFINQWKNKNFAYLIIKHFLPGVTDTKANTIKDALKLFNCKINIACGNIYLLPKTATPNDSLNGLVKKLQYNLFNPLIEQIKVVDLNQDYQEGFLEFKLFTQSTNDNKRNYYEEINLNLKDNLLEDISKNRLLALSLPEMKNVQNYFKNTKTQVLRNKFNLPHNPTDVELEIIAQTWSEHCKHKIFNSTITCNYLDKNKQISHSKIIHSLFKEFIESPTRQLAKIKPNLLSVFSDNAGIVKFNENYSICFKVETHNSPCALEPYGGAVTGLLGVNRDIMGTGLGAKPIFNTDILCLPNPFENEPIHPKLLPSRSIINGVRKGIEDAGNKSGIPCINGSVFFHNGYRAKPLVFCGTAGIMPLTINGLESHHKYTKINDRIVMVGGRVGADGIHGATFSSIPLAENSPKSAVQIGDPLTQKRMLDFLLKARDKGLITGITDNGAGGLSSSVGEMAKITNGATIDLNLVPLKYPGLKNWEITVSESQERMTVSTDRFEELKRLAENFNVEVTDIGYFHNLGYFEVKDQTFTVALLDLNFLHDGYSDLNLTATFDHNETVHFISEIAQNDVIKPNFDKLVDLNVHDIFLELLTHPNIASKEGIVRQYDHEVQGKTIIKPFTGKNQDGPNDAACVLLSLDSQQGIAVANGYNPLMSYYDCYSMAVFSVDEAIRNALCIGTNLDEIYLLDNFSFPDPLNSATNKLGENNLKCLIATANGLKDAVLAYSTPLISGKDSMKNDYHTEQIKLSDIPTLLISAIGKIDDITKCLTSSFKNSGDLVYLLSAGSLGIASSHFQSIYNLNSDWLPELNLNQAYNLYKNLNIINQNNLIQSAHDLSEGGLAITIAECLFGENFGAVLDISLVYGKTLSNKQSYIDKLPFKNNIALCKLFGEIPGSILVSLKPKDQSKFEAILEESTYTYLGYVTAESQLIIKDNNKTIINTNTATLNHAWKTSICNTF